jgi:CRP-like cAMP-binding protein
MPELDGYGVLHLLRKNTETENIPFIFLTAKAERVDIRKGMAMGADDYLTKPFDDVELLTVIESRLNKKKQQELFYSSTMDKIESLVDEEQGLDPLKKSIDSLRVRHVKKGQIIYHEGDLALGLYIMISGRCKTIQMSEDGRELITGIFIKDEYFGINTVLNAQAYTETASAMENSTFCLLPKDTFDELLSRFPRIGIMFIKILSNNIHDKEEQLMAMAYHSVRKRMAGVLLQLLKQEEGIKTLECLSVTREEMASMAGMASETVSHILSDFSDEGLITREKKRIRVLDKEKLSQLQN